jgi:hypothetical protein
MVPPLRRSHSTAEGQDTRNPERRSGVHHGAAEVERPAPEWQAAAEALLMAAEDRAPLMHARVGMMLELHGDKPIPEYDSSKERNGGTAKAQAGRMTGCVTSEGHHAML